MIETHCEWDTHGPTNTHTVHLQVRFWEETKEPWWNPAVFPSIKFFINIRTWSMRSPSSLATYYIRLFLSKSCHVTCTCILSWTLYLHAAYLNRQRRNSALSHSSNFVYRTSLQIFVIKSIINLYSGLHPGDAVADGHRSRTVSALLRPFILSICSPGSFLAHMQQYSHQSLLLLLQKKWKLAANAAPAPAQTMRVDTVVLSPTRSHILPECAHV